MCLRFNIPGVFWIKDALHVLNLGPGMDNNIKQSATSTMKQIIFPPYDCL